MSHQPVRCSPTPILPSAAAPLWLRPGRDMKQVGLALVVWAGVVLQAFAADGPMILLGGTPREVGSTWGEINKRAVAHDLDAYFLKQAAEHGISEAVLLERSRAFVRIATEIAPHWLEEARAIAQAAGVREDLYVSFIASGPRKLFLHECTSYAVSRNHARGGAILFHKTRDNVDKEQAAFIPAHLWEAIEQSAHLRKELVKTQAVASASPGATDRAAGLMDQWTQRQAEMLLAILQVLQ